VGVVLFGIVGGLAGGISRDLLLGTVPAPLLNPAYVVCTVGAALLALAIHYRSGQRFREGLFQFATSLALPWYAAIGVGKAVDAHLPYVAAILVGVVGATAGRYVVDLSAGVTPKQFLRGEWFVGTAVLVSFVYVACAAWLHWGLVPATLASFAVGFVFRYTALLRHWEEPEPATPGPAETPRPRIQHELHEEFGPGGSPEG
jgi:uncharacterized membrane protein YeiH